MPDALAVREPSQELDSFLMDYAEVLRAKDRPPVSSAEWQQRREKLRRDMFAAMQLGDEKPCPLTPRITGVLLRNGYRIEKIVFQSRPDVWVTANAYIGPGSGKRPAVLAVHGHWPKARRDPVVQARCLGLMHLGFFVLAVDAFGAGERYTDPHPGSYHGELYGSTLWPAGRTLLGMQVYDNRRAVDYLLTRPEVDGTRLGITGASGGGNQTMYAGALDERFAAVVPVCSVGTYPAYLRSACCVCEVLPGALRFTGEGDVLGLVAPRALLVINATRDSFVFSVGEATKSLRRARDVFRIYGADNKVRHATFESPHDYNQAMRETMYGWMTRWLKNEGDGKPIPEPKHAIETWDDLACYGKGERPTSFLTPPRFAALEAGKVLARWNDVQLPHAEAWDAAAVGLRSQLRKKLLGDFRRKLGAAAKQPKAPEAANPHIRNFTITPEPGIALPVTVESSPSVKGKRRTCLLLHLEGAAEASRHPLARNLVDHGWTVLTVDLRGTGTLRPMRDAIRNAPDHNSTEHALWVGRPLLGQWCVDIEAMLEWLGKQPDLSGEGLTLVGLGQAGVLALVAGALYPEQIPVVATVKCFVSLVTDQAYPPGTHMGLLVPGLFEVGDVPQLAALVLPRRLVLAAGLSSAGKDLTPDEMDKAFVFATRIDRLHKQKKHLRIVNNDVPDKIIVALGE